MSDVLSVPGAVASYPRVLVNDRWSGPHQDAAAPFARAALRAEQEALRQSRLRAYSDRADMSRRLWVQAVASIASWRAEDVR